MKLWVAIISFVMCPVLLIAQTCGTTNIALTQTVSASSTLDVYSLPANVVDGNNTSNWKSESPLNQWLLIDLGQSYSICNIELSWSTAFTFPTAYTVEISALEPAGSGTYVLNTTTADGGLDQISLSSPIVGRYIRIHTTARAATWADRYELFEVVVNSGAGNTPPGVALTNPTNNATFSLGSVITLNADANDDGTVTKVEFYEGTTKLGEDLSIPYSYDWANAPQGTYSLTAKAYDNDGAITTSTSITVTVSGAPASSGWSLVGNSATNPSSNFIGTLDNQPLLFKTNNNNRLQITADGQVLLNTGVSPDPEAHLAVKGNIWAMKIKVTQQNWADYVFDPDYRLMPISELADYIKKHKHLPEVPTEKDVLSYGVDIGANQVVLLKKIEELTLYMIEMSKKIEQLEKENVRLRGNNMK